MTTQWTEYDSGYLSYQSASIAAESIGLSEYYIDKSDSSETLAIYVPDPYIDDLELEDQQADRERLETMKKYILHDYGVRFILVASNPGNGWRGTLYKSSWGNSITGLQLCHGNAEKLLTYLEGVEFGLAVGTEKED